MRKIKRERGFSLIEVVIASTIISLSLLAIIGVAQEGIRVSRRALNTYAASTLLEEGAEVVRIVRDDAWTTISALSDNTAYYPTFSGGVWSLSQTPSLIDGFTRTVIFDTAERDGNDDLVTSGTPDSGTKLVTVTVSWNEGGEVVSKDISFYIADIFSS